MDDETQTSGPPDLAILLEAMEAVVGTVSKVYQAVRRAVISSDDGDYRRALAAFDGLPAWQKARILTVATARAAELADMPDFETELGTVMGQPDSEETPLAVPA